ncbi:MAG: hypothetical protein HY843_03400 [Bdellovibrio sp.]|nr:hypothetical protein [Bdellovibrio sp.]
MKKMFLCYFFSFIFLCLGCSVPRNDASNALGRQAISDAVNIALSAEDCTTAITLIEDLYSSENSDNYIRLLRASAQGCKAGPGNFFQFTGKLVNTTENPLAAVPSEGAYFWRTMAKLFYLDKTSSGATVVDSTGLDSRLDGALKATDALLASLKVPKTAVEFANKINT